jgi:hypothetical protein
MDNLFSNAKFIAKGIYDRDACITELTQLIGFNRGQFEHLRIRMVGAPMREQVATKNHDRRDKWFDRFENRGAAFNNMSCQFSRSASLNQRRQIERVVAQLKQLRQVHHHRDFVRMRLKPVELGVVVHRP